MKRLAMLALLLLFACAPQKPKISEDLKTRLNTVLEDGSTLSAMMEQGATFSDFSQQLAKAKSAYNLALATSSPKDIAPETKTELDAAFTGWGFAHDMWNDKNDPSNAFSYEHNTDLRIAIVAYAGEKDLQFGQNHQLTFDPNIGILLSIATEHWKAGQTLLLADLK